MWQCLYNETDSDGDNVTVSGDSDADSETDGRYDATNGQIWNKLLLLWVAAGTMV